MWSKVDQLAGFLLDLGVSSLALVGVIALGMILTLQPSRRLWLARAGLIGLVALVPLLALGVVPRYDLVSGLGSVIPPSDLLVEPSVLPPLEREFTHANQRWLARGLCLAYLGVVGVGGMRLLLGFFGLRWLTSRSRAPSPEAQSLLEALPRRAGVARPSLRVVDRMRRPALIGFIRPTILIPPGLDQPDAYDRLRLSLLHELAHAEAGDLGFGLISSLVQAGFSVLPPSGGSSPRCVLIRNSLRINEQQPVMGVSATTPLVFLDLFLLMN